MFFKRPQDELARLIAEDLAQNPHKRKAFNVIREETETQEEMVRQRSISSGIVSSIAISNERRLKREQEMRERSRKKFEGLKASADLPFGYIDKRIQR